MSLADRSIRESWWPSPESGNKWVWSSMDNRARDSIRPRLWQKFLVETFQSSSGTPADFFTPQQFTLWFTPNDDNKLSVEYLTPQGWLLTMICQPFDLVADPLKQSRCDIVLSKPGSPVYSVTIAWPGCYRTNTTFRSAGFVMEGQFWDPPFSSTREVEFQFYPTAWNTVVDDLPGVKPQMA